MVLFSNTPRDYLGPFRRQEPLFNFLERSGRPEIGSVRELMEKWVAGYPSSNDAEFMARIRSTDNKTFLASFFEMYLYYLMMSHGFDVELHPKLGNATSGKTPDFLVYDGGALRFIMEATSAAEPLANKDEKRRDIVLNEINKVRSPNFWLCVEFQSVGPRVPGLNGMRAALAAKLQQLDGDSTQLTDLRPAPTWRWEGDGWVIRFAALPRSSRSRNQPEADTIGIWPGYLGPIDSARPLANAVLEKATRYGEVPLPYVVAVNTKDMFLGDEDVANAVFGYEAVRFKIDQAGAVIGTDLVRTGFGRWGTPNGPRGTRVSALLVATSVAPWSITRSTPVLWHNPWAARPLAMDAWQGPQRVPDQESGSMIVRPGLSSAAMLGLPPEWPSPTPAQ